LRPEGTAGVVRAVLEHNVFMKNPIYKCYYIGPMFRYEKPQKGRYRQFNQIGVEAFGVQDPRIDVEILVMANDLLHGLGIPHFRLELNSLGCEDCRPAYLEHLVSYLKSKKGNLCVDCLKRLEKNPLRCLDCKQEGCAEVLAGAPHFIDDLCAGCNEHFGSVKKHLGALKVDYVVNPRIVRGLDYYSRTAFEVVSEGLGAQNAILAGGRYDSLVSLLGGPNIPAIGFALGVERLLLLVKQTEKAKSLEEMKTDLFVAALGEGAFDQSITLVQEMRRQGIHTETDYSGKSLKSQMRQADRLGARFVAIIGEDELAKGVALVRDMEKKTQEEVPLLGLGGYFVDKIKRR
jgi:histidyl-tRNA synthetase